MRNPLSRSVLTVSMLALSMSLSIGAGWAVTPQSLQYFKDAQVAERHGHLADAETALRKSITLAPDDYLGYVKLASILSQLDRPNEAISYYQKAMALPNTDPMIPFSIGAIYEQLGNYAKAEEFYRVGYQNNPRYQFALMNLARVEIQQRKYVDATSHYKAFLDQYPDHFEARRRYANLLLVSGMEAESASQYELLKARNPEKFADHVNLARALTRSNSPQEALKELKEAYEKEGSKADISEEMGNAHIALGQSDYAIFNYKKAYELNPEKEDLLLKIADLYRKQKNPNEAVVTYQTYLVKHPDNTDVRRLLADVYLEDNQYGAAIAEMNTLLASETEPAERYALAKDIGFAYQMKGDLPAATAQYEKLLDDPLAENDLQLKMNLALAYHKTGNLENAVTLYKNIYYADPQQQTNYKLPDKNALGNDMANALVLLGDKAYQASDFNRATALYGEASLFAKKENPTPYLGLGNSYFALNMPDKAYDAYKLVLERDPNNMTARLNSAKIELSQKQDRTDSLAELEKLAKLHPENEDILLTLASTYDRRNEPLKAIPLYERALAAHPEDTDLLMALASQWQKMDNFEQAKNTYQKVIAKNPNIALAHYNLGILYNELGQLDNSVASYQAALRLDPSYADSLYGLAVTYEKQQKYAEALDTYRSYTQQPTANYMNEANERITLIQQARPNLAQPAQQQQKQPPVNTSSAQPKTGLQMPAVRETLHAQPGQTEPAMPVIPVPLESGSQLQPLTGTPAGAATPVR